MEKPQQSFLMDLLETPSPSGYEAEGQQRWIEYVEQFADDVRTDDYGNAVGILEGDKPAIAVAGHADEIGYIVRKIDEDGFIHLGRIGGSDRTVSRGQHVEIHTSDGTVPGVIGQDAIHLRETGEETYDDINEQQVDIGVANGETAQELVDVGDPVTIATTVKELQDGRIAGRGLDNRIGTWVAAETLRRAAARDVDVTVYAVSTVQEEIGLKGAQMIGEELAPDAAIAVDVTHATDYPSAPQQKASDIDVGAGPVVGRGSANHPKLADAVRDAAATADIDIQLDAAGLRTGTDADAFYTQAGGTPALNVGVPNRYMHTPVELLDLDDLDMTAELLVETVAQSPETAPFSVEL